MKENITITSAKARLSELINRLIHRNDVIFITRKGKSVAALVPIDTYRKMAEEGKPDLLSAAGALAGLDREIDELVAVVYRERDRAKDREVPL